MADTDEEREFVEDGKAHNALLWSTDTPMERFTMSTNLAASSSGSKNLSYKLTVNL